MYIFDHVPGQQFNWRKYVWKVACNHLSEAVVSTTAVLVILKSSGVVMGSLLKSMAPYLEKMMNEDYYLTTLCIAASLHVAIFTSRAMALLQSHSKLTHTR